MKTTFRTIKKKEKTKLQKKKTLYSFIVAFTVILCMQTRSILCLKKNNLRTDGCENYTRAQNKSQE